MSGTAFGTIVLHIAPESAVGGPLALVQNGDRIRLDVAESAGSTCWCRRRSSRRGAAPGGRARRRRTTCAATASSISTRAAGRPRLRLRVPGRSRPSTDSRPIARRWIPSSPGWARCTSRASGSSASGCCSTCRSGARRPRRAPGCSSSSSCPGWGSRSTRWSAASTCRSDACGLRNARSRSWSRCVRTSHRWGSTRWGRCRRDSPGRCGWPTRSRCFPCAEATASSSSRIIRGRSTGSSPTSARRSAACICSITSSRTMMWAVPWHRSSSRPSGAGWPSGCSWTAWGRARSSSASCPGCEGAGSRSSSYCLRGC